MALDLDLDVKILSAVKRALVRDIVSKSSTIQRSHMPRHRVTARVEGNRVVVRVTDWVGGEPGWISSMIPDPAKVEL